MAFNFPNSPADGALFTPVANGPSWTWSAATGAWMITSGGLSAGVYIGDLPPANPAIGQLWWNSTTGLTFIWFNDGNSSQWVQFNSGPLGSDPYRFNSADMSLLSMAAGVVGLNTKADGSGTSSKLWTDANNTQSGGGAKFANGLIFNYGIVNTNSNGDANVTFVVPFSSANNYSISTILNTGSSVATTLFYGATFCNVAAGSCSFQARSLANGGAVSQAGTSQIRWMAIGT